jgi:hypothetical protein
VAITVKPIETEYNGYRFRSRLEARWAVFFDAAGIEYEYEAEGFDLGDGVWYLPDFYLPWFSAYVEIKPSNISDADKKSAMKKCEKLCHSSKNRIALLCVGDPLDNNMLAYCTAIGEDCFYFCWTSAEFAEGCWFSFDVNDVSEENAHRGFTKHWINILAGGKTDYQNISYVSSSATYCGLEQKARLCFCRSDLYDCKLKARQARFEFGEHGGITK